MKSFTMTNNVVDVHFHKSNRPEGRFSDVKHYFSGKYYQYGLKVESAHYPNGLAAYVSRNHHGSTHGFKTNVKSYKRLLTKSVSDNLLEDNGHGCLINYDIMKKSLLAEDVVQCF